MVGADDLAQRGAEVLARLGVVVVQPRGWQVPQAGDLADRQALVETQAQELDAVKAALKGREYELGVQSSYANLVGRSEPMRAVFKLLEKVASSDVPILGDPSTARLAVAGLQDMFGEAAPADGAGADERWAHGLVQDPDGRPVPGARVVHCVRDPIDNGFACFKMLFSSGVSFSYDLREIGARYRAHARLMDHWRGTLGERMLDVAYEDVVADQEGEFSREQLDALLDPGIYPKAWHEFILDMMEAHPLSIDILQEAAHGLLDGILRETDREARGHLFDLLERILQHQRSVDIPVESLIERFDESDTALIASTMLLLPLVSGEHQDLARRYMDHDDQFVRNNATYALTYLRGPTASG